MKNKDYNQNNNIYIDDTNNTQSTSNENNNDAEATFKSIKQLEIVNVNINIVYIVLFSQFLNLNYLYSEKNRLLDQLNGVENEDAEEIQLNLNQIRILARRLIIFASLTSIAVDLQLLTDVLSQEEPDPVEVNNIKQTLLADILLYTAAKISEGVLFTSIYPSSFF